ncbi:MAG: hypothetical protein ACXVDD_18125, partial [Polyangia bacterium]
CGGQCQACDIAGKQGTCSTVTSGQPHHGAACAGAGTPTCGGSCNGSSATACYVPPATTKVVKATCTARDVLGGATYCDGNGNVGAARAAVACDPYACQSSGSSSTDDSCLKQCATVAQCANDNLACNPTNQRCGYPDGAACKQAAPQDCASDYCASAANGPVCCGSACNTCTFVAGPNGNHNFMPDCTGGRCANGTDCGQFQCDANAVCKTKCFCPTVNGHVCRDSPDCIKDASGMNNYCTDTTGAGGRCSLG